MRMEYLPGRFGEEERCGLELAGKILWDFGRLCQILNRLQEPGDSCGAGHSPVGCLLGGRGFCFAGVAALS
jgi:hypothetical protein